MLTVEERIIDEMCRHYKNTGKNLEKMYIAQEEYRMLVNSLGVKARLSPDEDSVVLYGPAGKTTVYPHRSLMEEMIHKKYR